MSAAASGPPTVGVLGGGQLGRMLALAGIPLGLRFRFLDPDPESPAGEVGELVVGRYDDDVALTRFAEGVTVASYEFENVPAHTAEWLTARVPVFPPRRALEVSQDRVSEKSLFRELGTGTPAFMPIDSLEDLRRACRIGGPVGLPCVLKTRRFGYDGKGQAVLRTPDDFEPALKKLLPGVNGDARTGGLIAEAMVSFRRELSIVAARSRSGETAFYPLVENVHRAGILRRTNAPAPGVSPDLRARAETAAATLLKELDYVGVLAIEFFETENGDLLASEFAPRVHNSGHWSIEGARTSQFENHLRAILGWPLGSAAAVGASVMLNLIGDAPPVQSLLACPGARPHLYDKSPRPGRKIGHVTVTGVDAAEASVHAAAIERLLIS